MDRGNSALKRRNNPRVVGRVNELAERLEYRYRLSRVVKCNSQLGVLLPVGCISLDAGLHLFVAPKPWPVTASSVRCS